MHAGRYCITRSTRSKLYRAKEGKATTITFPSFTLYSHLLLQQTCGLTIVLRSWLGSRYLHDIGEDIVVDMSDHRAYDKSTFTTIFFHSNDRQLGVLIGRLREQPGLCASIPTYLTGTCLGNNGIW